MPRAPRTMAQRAQIFNSFDALKGFKELLREQEKVVVAKRYLSEDDYELLNRLIFRIQPGMIVKVVYFDNGEYIQKEGRVAKINFDTKILQIVKTKIKIQSIVEIHIEDDKDMENVN